VYSGKLIFTAMYFRRSGIESRCYAADSTQVSTGVTPLALAAQISGVKKSGGGAFARE
jgi:hypothetical protein